MAIDFPGSPALNDEYTYQGKTWKWDGDKWLFLSTMEGVPEGGSTGQVLKKNSNTSFDTSWGTASTVGSINDLSDVTISTPATDQVLKYNGAEWVNGAASSSGHAIQEEGTPLTARAGLNFIGTSVTATDDAANNRTNVTISAGGTTWTESASAPSGGSDGDWHSENTTDMRVVWRKESGTWKRRFRQSPFLQSTTANANLIANGSRSPWGVLETTLTDLCDVIASGTSQSSNLVTLSNTSTGASYKSNGYVGTEDANAAFTVNTLPSTGSMEFGLPVNLVNSIFVGFIRVTSAGVATAVSGSTTKFTFGTTVNTATQAGTVFSQVTMKGGLLFCQANGPSHATNPNLVVSSVLVPDQYAIGYNLWQYGITPYFRGSGSGTAAKVNIDSMEFNG